MALRQRLLHDIAEIQNRPYPNIRLVIDESDLTDACLVLEPNGGAALHLTIQFPENYPLCPPRITIQSSVDHPNVFGDYICASILNTTEGYTPAYTLKGICIQLLSFFSSDRLEQSNGDQINLAKRRQYLVPSRVPYKCQFCSFDSSLHAQPPTHLRSSAGHSLFDCMSPFRSRLRRSHGSRSPTPSAITEAPKPTELQPVPEVATPQTQPQVGGTGISDLPDELLNHICSYLEVEELVPFSQAWNRIGGTTGIISNFNIVRNRELICFCLKKDFTESQLGVGVNITRTGRFGSFASEFDLLSLQAFTDHDIRRSVQGLAFHYWLPLPISRNHWRSVQDLASERLQDLARASGFHVNVSGPTVDVIYAFMNDIVVRLCADTNKAEKNTDPSVLSSRSSLLYASEKAIESYYHLYHLLLCFATSPTNRNIIRNVNRTIKSFLDGNTSKRDVPNLGYLLIMVLISDADMTVDLLMAIISETVTRNVVWVLDSRGANMPELSYLEVNAISEYRLQKTFEASLTSYRLLMFLNIFRRTINRGNRTLVQVRDSLFDAHGAPPHGTAARLANDIKKLQQVKNFPEFLTIMGLTPPCASKFTAFLRNCVEASVIKGYSVWGITQERALTLRRIKDPSVQERKPADQKPQWKGRSTPQVSFFPDLGKKGRVDDLGVGRGAGGERGRGQGGRGRGGRGRGY